MTLLEVTGLRAGYGRGPVLHGVDFTVDDGEIVGILGPNGAGKTTALRAVSGLLDLVGSVRLEGRELRGCPAHRVAAWGVAHVPQDRGTFTGLTVEENLRVGAYIRRDGDVRADIARACTWFPRLGERRTQLAGSLSGGEQQMLAIARALMLRPRLLLLDEPSLGLAPLVTRELFEILAAIGRNEGLALLLVEQNAGLALTLAHHAYVLEAGRVALHGDAASLQADDRIRRSYLGL
jgi:branched-chain amino acid transport system ATP-binding protein